MGLYSPACAVRRWGLVIVESCPFCHEEVDDDLVRLGGTCPRCFGEIPGEEAPTDPGEDRRELQETADLKAVGSSHRILPLLLITPVLLAIIGFAGWTLFAPEPQPVAQVLDFDVGTYAMSDIPFEAYVEPEPEPEPEPKPKARPRPRPAGSPAASAPDTETELVVADAEPVPVSPRSQVQAGGAFGIDVGVSRRAQKGVRLVDDSAIVEMIKGVLTAELPRLKSCYEQRLKVKEDLAGRWMLTLVVGREGEPKDIAVVGRSVSDDQLEACVVGKVTEWSFQPIRADQPVQKTLTFKPGW